MVMRVRGRTVALFVCLLGLVLPLIALAQTEPSDFAENWVDTNPLPGATLFRAPASGFVKNLYGTFSFYGVEGTAEEIARLWLEWSGAIGKSPDWTNAANSLLVADKELNPDATGAQSNNQRLLMSMLKGPGILAPLQSSQIVYVVIEHADLSKLTVTVGVRNGTTVLHSEMLETVSGSGTHTWVRDCSDWPGHFPPSASNTWFVRVEEITGDTVIHDQGVIREFHVSQDSLDYAATDVWVPIIEDQTVESAIPSPAVSNYAEITLWHEYFPELEMVLGVKDLTDEDRIPGLQFYLTKNGTSGEAGSTETRVIKVNLNAFSDRLPASLARRWYLGVRDTDTYNEWHGQIVNFRVYTNGSPQNGAGLPADISETAPQYINLSVSPPTTASASARLTSAGTVTVKAGVGPTGSPYWLSGAWASPYTSIGVSSSSTYWPPDLTYRWFLSVTRSNGSTGGTINRFALYDPEAPRVYRSASPPVNILPNATVYAKVPFKSTATFSDVPTDHWAWMEIEGLNKAGIATGYGDGTFLPDSIVKRDGMAVFTARAHAGGDANVPPGPGSPTFPDVPTSYWAYKHIEYCASRHIVSGYEDGKYHPEYNIDRGQLAVFIARAIGGKDIMSPPASPTYTDVQPDFWAFKDIEYLTSSMNASGGKVVGGYADGKYHPEYTISRGAMSVFIARAFAVPQ